MEKRMTGWQLKRWRELLDYDVPMAAGMTGCIKIETYAAWEASGEQYIPHRMAHLAFERMKGRGIPRDAIEQHLK